jgi:hypothetical protein
MCGSGGPGASAAHALSHPCCSNSTVHGPHSRAASGTACTIGQYLQVLMLVAPVSVVWEGDVGVAARALAAGRAKRQGSSPGSRRKRSLLPQGGGAATAAGQQRQQQQCKGSSAAGQQCQQQQCKGSSAAAAAAAAAVQGASSSGGHLQAQDGQRECAVLPGAARDAGEVGGVQHGIHVGHLRAAGGMAAAGAVCGVGLWVGGCSGGGVRGGGGMYRCAWPGQVRCAWDRDDGAVAANVSSGGSAAPCGGEAPQLAVPQSKTCEGTRVGCSSAPSVVAGQGPCCYARLPSGASLASLP